ncbi:unnamed protein product [Timema podura]|uniref:Importin N-terminal domain-containing protein n=1 Tax=Timema podura TaxID=61482 RepID=A0ABN7P0A3_TIMPD|nr:unnamed protein product [Timema podura]
MNTEYRVDIRSDGTDAGTSVPVLEGYCLSPGYRVGSPRGCESMDMNAAGTLVLETLHQASSQDTEVLKPAEQRLKQWETEPGAISEEEKCSLRQGLASSFTEPVSQVATQIAVLISKVARLDCPREWPELVPCLLTAVKSDSALVQHRALLVLHHVVKTLSSKRLAGDRRLFQELTAGVFAFVLNLWNTHYESFLAQVCHNNHTYYLTIFLYLPFVLFGFHFSV